MSLGGGLNFFIKYECVYAQDRHYKGLLISLAVIFYNDLEQGTT